MPLLWFICLVAGIQSWRWRYWSRTWVLQTPCNSDMLCSTRMEFGNFQCGRDLYLNIAPDSEIEPNMEGLLLLLPFHLQKVGIVLGRPGHLRSRLDAIVVHFHILERHPRECSLQLFRQPFPMPRTLHSSSFLLKQLLVVVDIAESLADMVNDEEEGEVSDDDAGIVEIVVSPYFDCDFCLWWW